MANRRMFSHRIANSARFLQMPTDSQLLYFHMVMRADDDGIVECYPLMRLLGLASDNFKVLVAKEFIRQLNEDQVIVVTDWLEHNSIRADRKVNSIYHHLLPPDIETIEPKPRSDVEDNSKRLGGQSTDGIREVKLSKDSISKEKEVENSLSFLRIVPEVTLLELSGKYHISGNGIQSKATDLRLYCEQKGKVYKNYKSFLENAIRKDKLKLQQEFPLAVVVEKEILPELSEEQKEKNQQIRENISNMLKAKHM